MPLIARYIALLILISFHVFAQTGELKSLLAQLPNAKPDTNLVKLLNKIGDEYAYNELKTARKYYKRGYDLSQKLQFTRGIIRYYSSEGELLNLEGKYIETVALLHKGIDLSLAKKDKMREGIMCENMGNTLALMQKLDSASYYYFRALRLFESFADSIKIANVYNDLSSVFTQTDKQEVALNYINKAIGISKNYQDGFYLSHLINKENILWKLRRRKEAVAANNEIIILSKKLNDTVGLADALQNICNHDVDTQQYLPLMTHAKDLAKIKSQLNDNERASLADYWLSVAYYYQENYFEAKKYIELAIAAAQKLKNSNHLSQYYKQYTKLLLATNQAPTLAEKYNKLADSLDNISLNNSILRSTKELQTKYETEKKEQAIVQISKENKNKTLWIFLLSAATFLLAATLGFFGLWLRNRNRIRMQEQLFQELKLKELETEKQLLAGKAVLKGQDEERSRLAKDLHDGLGGILSSVKYSFLNMKHTFVLQAEHAHAFEKSMNLLDTSLAELRRVSHNMMPESLAKLGLEEALKDYLQTIDENSAVKFTYQSFGLSDISIENIYSTTIFRIVQELSTNIIRHANAKNALVQIMAKNEQISITIEDDGLGFDTSNIDNSKSMGLQNLYNRVAYLGGKVDLKTEPNAGCSYYIEIPLNND